MDLEVIRVTSLQPEDPPAYVANGFAGLRIGPVPWSGGTAVVNGFFGEHPAEGVEALEEIPYPIGGDIRIGHRWMSLSPARAEFLEQSYDMGCGELRSAFVYRTGEAAAAIEITVFCSRTMPTLIVERTSVTVDRPCGIGLRSCIDHREAPGSWLKRHTPGSRGSWTPDGAMLWQSVGGASRVGIAYATVFSGTDDCRRERTEQGERSLLHTDYAFRAEPGRTYTVDRIVSCVPSMLHGDPDRQAIRLAYLGAQKGFDALREDNRQAWADLWKGRVLIEAEDPKWQRYADAAYFYLHTSVHASSPNSTGLFGLGPWKNYHGFLGHVFWDIETFALPPLLLTAPHAAKALLRYRTRNLEAAGRNAALHGYRGLMFPWESGTRGEEVTPSGWPQIMYEQHVTLDIAFAFSQYAHASGDELFLREMAWPVLRGAAEWLESRVVWTERGCELRGVMGIDEGAANVDNNSWTNALAIVTLREAIAAARRLGYSPPPSWEAMAEAMYMPVDGETRVLLKYDGYRYREGDHCCPDSLCAFFPLNYRTDPGVERETFAQFLRWSESSIGYPMHSPLHGVWACRIGDRKLALERLERGVADYIFGPYLETDEFGSSYTATKEKVGPYLAHAGGYLLSCMYGFTGLQIGEGEPSEWLRHPVVLPEGWESVRIGRVWIRGRPARLTARQGDERARLEFL